MNKDIAYWARTKTCLPCQWTKINKHTRLIPEKIAVPRAVTRDSSRCIWISLARYLFLKETRQILFDHDRSLHKVARGNTSHGNDSTGSCYSFLLDVSCKIWRSKDNNNRPRDAVRGRTFQKVDQLTRL